MRSHRRSGLLSTVRSPTGSVFLEPTILKHGDVHVLSGGPQVPVQSHVGGAGDGETAGGGDGGLLVKCALMSVSVPTFWRMTTVNSTPTVSAGLPGIHICLASCQLPGISLSYLSVTQIFSSLFSPSNEISSMPLPGAGWMVSSPLRFVLVEPAILKQSLP